MSMSRLSKTFCDSSVVYLYFKYPPPARPPNFCLCQREMPSILQTEVGGGGGEAVNSGSTWLWSSLDQGPGLDMNIERSSTPYRSARDTVTGRADRWRLNCLSARLWMSFKNRQVQESGGEREQSSFFLSSCWQVKDKFPSIWSLHLSLLLFPFSCQPPLPSSVSVLLLCSSCRNN